MTVREFILLGIFGESIKIKPGYYSPWAEGKVKKYVKRAVRTDHGLRLLVRFIDDRGYCMLESRFAFDYNWRNIKTVDINDIYTNIKFIVENFR